MPRKGKMQVIKVEYLCVGNGGDGRRNLVLLFL